MKTQYLVTKLTIISLALSLMTSLFAAEVGPISIEERVAAGELGESSSNNASKQANKVLAQQAPAASGGAMYELLLQMERLQDELANLRGQIEEQEQQISLMREEQRTRYLDLDGRISALNEGALNAAAASSSAAQSGASVSGSTNNNAELSDRQLYEQATTRIRARQFEAAVADLNMLLEKFPDSDYVPYSYYWLGEVLMVLPEPDFAGAKAYFAKLIKFYPNHPKMPATLFKMGKVQHQLGEDAQAKKMLERVQVQYPESESAKLAMNYLQQLAH